MEPFVVVFFAEVDGDGFFRIHAAVLAENFETGVLCEGGVVLVAFDEFYVYGDFLVEPVVGTVVRDFFLGVGAGHVDSAVGVKERVRICGEEHGRNGRLFFENVGADDFGLRSV